MYNLSQLSYIDIDMHTCIYLHRHVLIDYLISSMTPMAGGQFRV